MTRDKTERMKVGRVRWKQRTRRGGVEGVENRFWGWKDGRMGDGLKGRSDAIFVSKIKSDSCYFFFSFLEVSQPSCLNLDGN